MLADCVGQLHLPLFQLLRFLCAILKFHEDGSLSRTDNGRGRFPLGKYSQHSCFLALFLLTPAEGGALFFVQLVCP